MKMPTIFTNAAPEPEGIKYVDLYEDKAVLTVVFDGHWRQIHCSVARGLQAISVGGKRLR